MSKNPTSIVPKSAVRCAVYTRKSTEEGLEQAFNSLDAQREAAEAYISSQKGEGWECLPTQYNDGGFSGGNMERPALKLLLDDVASGRIDCVIVYKVDRLSRSLLDFARLMEVFDRYNVTFVSVTQQFNTTNSMGRLTLNILLSFAQFERELITERTKDKMAASRRKGKWVGGHPFLGYDIAPAGGKLIVNEEEAKQVRTIFELYLKCEGLTELAKELNARGWHTKSWTSSTGKSYGGKPFAKNILHHMLHNYAYAGKVKYEGNVYDGEHEAIIDAETWNQVQAMLSRNGRTGGREVRSTYCAPLKGLLRCGACGCAMTHTSAKRGSRVYRYYVCQHSQQQGAETCPGGPLKASEIEQAVLNQIKSFTSNTSLVEAMLNKLQKQRDEETSLLAAEIKALQQSSSALSKELIESLSLGRQNVAEALQTRLRGEEQELSLVSAKLENAIHKYPTEEECRRALEGFFPVWEMLSPNEQTWTMRLLLESVTFDAAAGAVTLAYRSRGILEFVQKGGTK